MNVVDHDGAGAGAGPEPRVSVVVPCYNAAETIEAAMASALGQSFADLELIVVDDGSEDDTARRVEALAIRDFRVRLIQKANGGVSSARNVGIAAARGEFIAFLDADDLWHREKLAWQLDLMMRHPEAGLCFTAFAFWNPERDTADTLFAERGPVAGAAPSIDPKLSGWIYHILLRDVYVWTSAVLVRSSVLDEVGGFDEGLPVGEDYDLWLRIAQSAPMIKADSVLAVYRQMGSSLTTLPHRKNYQALVLERAVARFGVQSPDGRELAAEEVQSILARLWFRFGYRWFWVGDYILARQAFTRSLEYRWQLRSRAYQIACKPLVLPFLNYLRPRVKFRGDASQ